MATNKLKPLVIETVDGIKSGELYKWTKLHDTDNFIKSIKTQELDSESRNINKIISGIPTPLARAKIFQYAIEYIPEDGEKPRGIMSFFKAIQDEWKGLIACIALDNARIEIRKVKMAYSDGKDIQETDNVFEVKGALRNMLFEDKELWCNQNELNNSTVKKDPYLYLIYYSGVLVGATSPHSIVFTSPRYRIEAGFNLIDSATQKFTDPLKTNLEFDNLQALYIYVKHIREQLGVYEKHFGGRLKVNKLYNFLDNWLKEMSAYAQGRMWTLSERAIVTNINLFDTPFDILFNRKTKLYGKNGRISFENNLGDDAIIVDPSELLLPHDKTSPIRFEFNSDFDASKAPVFYLEVDDGPNKKYYSIPLSEKGLLIFQDHIGGLLGQVDENENKVKSRIYGKYNSKHELVVTMEIEIEGIQGKTIVKRIYSEAKYSYSKPEYVDNKQIIVWPDFVAPEWNKYYCFSELPHNSQEDVISAFPLLADKTDFRFLTTKVKMDVTVFEDKLIYIKPHTEIEDIDKQIYKNAAILVEYDPDRLSKSNYNYEIYETDKPYKGIEFRWKGIKQGALAGYVVAKNTSNTNDAVLKDYRYTKKASHPVNVGIDFGSNNSCISYFDDVQDEEPKLIKFKNRRKFILGTDISDNKNDVAKGHEIFFFQNEFTPSNEVKSVLMLHDRSRINQENIDRLVVSGFPCFEKNLPIVKSEETKHILNFSIFEAHLLYNMKWSLDNDENKYKEGFIKALWLMTYAELFDLEKYPAKLNWAYPSVMGKNTLMKYNFLWREIVKLNPLETPNDAEVSEQQAANEGFKALTEAEAVSNYALSKAGKINLEKDTLAISCDVGGSTTDISCLIIDNGKPVLIKQSSIRVAAGKLADATAKSDKVQAAISSYCKKANLFIYGMEDNFKPNKKSETAPYYFNAVVDRLGVQRGNKLNDFYGNLYKIGASELFVVNSYLTGLIMFYIGQIAAKVKSNWKKSEIKRFEFGFYGKGGRMFDWIPAIVGENKKEEYYKNCFATGYNSVVEDISEMPLAKYIITDETLVQLQNNGVDKYVVSDLKKLTNKSFPNKSALLLAIEEIIGEPDTKQHEEKFVKYADAFAHEDCTYILTADNLAAIEKEIGQISEDKDFAKTLCEDLTDLKDKEFETLSEFENEVIAIIHPDDYEKFKGIIVDSARKVSVNSGEAKYIITGESIKFYKQNGISNSICRRIESNLQGKGFETEEEFAKLLIENIGERAYERSKDVLLKYAENVEKTASRPEDFEIVIKPSNVEHTKSEVSFGLAVNNVLQNREQIAEIFGEKGFTYNSAIIDPIADILPEHFSKLNSKLQLPAKFEIFEQFLAIFDGFVRTNLSHQLPDLTSEVRSFKISNHITNIPEYRLASTKAEKDFDFVAPMLIIEGIAYFEDVIMKKLFPDT